MSELQNRMIKQLKKDGWRLHGNASYDRHERLIKAALALYFTAGGRADVLVSTVAAATSSSAPIDTCIARLLAEVAAVSRAHDLDMVQAAHNWLDSASSSTS
jgi:hypothetical protein